jgi:hypothetical protein
MCEMSVTDLILKMCLTQVVVNLLGANVLIAHLQPLSSHPHLPIIIHAPPPQPPQAPWMVNTRRRG